MRILFTFCIGLCSLWGTAQLQPVNYLYWNVDCMNKYNYVSTGETQTTDFYLKQSADHFIAFHIKKPSQSTWQNKAPEKTLDCATQSLFTTQAITDINKGRKQLFIVEKVGPRYRYHQVFDIKTIEASENQIAYESTSFSFSFRPKVETDRSKNLIQRDVFGGTLHFKTAEMQNKLPTYTFVYYPDGAKIAETYTFAAHLGLIKMETAKVNHILSTINDAPWLRVASFAARGTRKIPSPSIAPKTPQEAKPMDADCIHVVREGETLYEISERSGRTMDWIKRRNHLENSQLKLKQILYLCGEPDQAEQPPYRKILDRQEGVVKTVHTVRKGDNLHDLARRYQTSIANIERWNNLATEALQINQELIVQKVSAPNK